MEQDQQPLAQKTDEKGANTFVTAFYVELDSLIGAYSQYVSVLVDLERSGGVDSSSTMPELNEETMKAVEIVLSNIRYRSIKAYIQYKSIIKKIKDDDKRDKKITKIYAENIRSYNKSTPNYYIEREIIEEFVMELNQFLVEKVLTLAPQTSAEIFGKLS